MKKWIILAAIVLSLSLIISNCSSKSSKKEAAGTLTKFTVKAEPFTKPLYFSGTIAPLNSSTLTCPVDGVIIEQNFSYGQRIVKGQKLFVINSAQLEQDFHDSLSGYLKALDDYGDKQRKFAAAENLRKLQFMSDDDYYSAKSDRDESYMSLLQARYKLIQTLSQLGLDTNLEQYKDLGRERIIQALLKKWDRITILSPDTGLALAPDKESTDSGVAALGSDVKKGQILMTIGELTGLSVKISIGETDVHSIVPGLKVKVTGPAFSDYQLEGFVKTVDSQANNDSGSPSFPAVVAVPKLTLAEIKTINVGMSAKVQIDLVSNDVITIPLASVFEKGGNNMVKIENPKTGEISEVQIETGDTTADSVIVKQGLKTGDIVVYSSTNE